MLASWHGRGAGGAVGGGLEFVGSRTFPQLGTTSTFTVPLTALTGGIASAPRTGDLVVAFIGMSSLSGSRDLTMPSGWAELDRVQGNNTYNCDLYVIYKTMSATPDTGFDIVGGMPSVNSSLAVTIHVHAGASAAAPSFTTANGGNSVLCNPPEITPTVAGSEVISGGVGGHIEGERTFSSSSFDSFLSEGVDGVGKGRTDCTIGVGRFAWTSGVFDPAAFTFSGSSLATSSWAALSLVIIPE